jgi:hypothetical protein
MDGLYNAKGYDQEDMDLAILCCSIGGPRLLYTLNKIKGLPSETLVRQNKTSKFHGCARGVDYTVLESNIKEMILKDADKEVPIERCGYGIFIDELALEERLRYNPSDDSVYGICYEHGKSVCICYSFASNHIFNRDFRLIPGSAQWMTSKY